MRREAKQVIDALKAKHAEATEALKAEHKKELDAARKAGGASAGGSSKSDPGLAPTGLAKRMGQYKQAYIILGPRRVVGPLEECA